MTFFVAGILTNFLIEKKIYNYLFQGQETTSNMLAFCLLELGQNPDILKKFLYIIIIEIFLNEKKTKAKRGS